jgi:hypothetical protein
VSVFARADMVTVRGGGDKDKMAAVGFNVMRQNGVELTSEEKYRPTKKLQWRDETQTNGAHFYSADRGCSI